MSVLLDYLFPSPSLPPSRLAPPHSLGVSPASTETLQTVLKDNHTKWHAFCNKRRFHNHAAPRAIALWTLGADADVIRKRYETDCGDERPRQNSPEVITEDKFNEHLGDDTYYDAYLQFLAKYVEENGIASTLERFIFSVRANVGMDSDLPIKQQPQMLARFLSGVLHPFIHTGCSAEFGLPGSLVEGLAETAVHHSPSGFLEPLTLFTRDGTLTTSPKLHRAMGDPHALTILARVLRDPELLPIPEEAYTIYPRTIKKYGKEIAAHVNEWNIDPGQLENGWEKKLEEIIWTVVVLYGVGGWTNGRSKATGFNADFYLMHLVTSSIFLPSICALISPLSRARLLKAYLAATCVWAITRGRPSLDAKGFAEDMQWSPDSCSGSGSETLWAKWIELAKVHPDKHLTKSIRSLAGWARVFGSRRCRLPLSKRTKSVKSALVIDAGVANDQLTKGGNREGEITFEDADLSPRAWSDWENGKLISPTLSSGEVRDSWSVSNDSDLIPKTWREAVNDRYAGQMSSKPSQLESLRYAGVNGTDVMSGNGDDYMPSTELPGSEYLDGSLFLSVATLTFRRMGWDIQNGLVVERRSKDGEFEAGFWDFDVISP